MHDGYKSDPDKDRGHIGNSGKHVYLQQFCDKHVIMEATI